MKALVYTSKEGLTVKEVPDPVIAPGRVIMKVTNCGICGSDLFLFKSGGLKDGTIMGHELSGIVQEVGEGVTKVKPGDRVIGRPTGCGECKFCKQDMENICTLRKSIGLGQAPGGFAELLAVDEGQCIPVPENLGLDQACMADQFGSALHGIRMINFKEGESAMVTGAGPIGLCAVMLLKYYGASKILVSEMMESRAELALKFGADAFTSPANESMPTAISKNFEPGGPDVLIECTGNNQALTQVIQCAPVGCRIAMVGMCTQPVTFLPFAMFQKHLTLVGSFGNSQTECIESMNVMASGKVPSQDLITKKVPLEEMPDAFQEVMTSKDQLKVMMEQN